MPSFAQCILQSHSPEFSGYRNGAQYDPLLSTCCAEPPTDKDERRRIHFLRFHRLGAAKNGPRAGRLTDRRWRTASTRQNSKNPTGRKHRRARLADHALVFPKTSRLSPKTRRLFATSSRVFFSLTRVGAHTQRVFVFCLHPSHPNSKH